LLNNASVKQNLKALLDDLFGQGDHAVLRTDFRGTVLIYYGNRSYKFPILPRCMECRRGLAMRIMSVCPFVCLSNAWIVTKQKKNQSRFAYHMKDQLA